MSDTHSTALDPCRCCAGILQSTPQSLHNLPGLSALVYRTGTHASFKASTLAALSTAGTAEKALGLTTRANDDPSIALLDAASVLLDVLTFYQERIANEGFLRTATERRSVLELARQIGYELNPGVAANTPLAFTLESAAGAPKWVTIPKGARVQSLPGQDEKPQTFETIEAIEARAQWNTLKPQTMQTAFPLNGEERLVLQGAGLNLKPGDMLLVVGEQRYSDPASEAWMLRIVKDVVQQPGADASQSQTIVTLDQALSTTLGAPKVFVLRQRANLFGYNAPDWRSLSKIIKASYLGLPETSSFSAFPDWPDFSIAGVSDQPNLAANGLVGEYFNNQDFTGFKLERTDAQVNFHWDSGVSPAPAIDGSTFSIRWTGWVNPTASGWFNFRTTSDDGVRLWVNGLLLIDDWTEHGDTDNSGNIPLNANQKVQIKLEYFNSGGPGTIRLYWMPPGGSEALIPTGALFPRDIKYLHLDSAYPQIQKGTWMVLSAPGMQPELYRVNEAAIDAQAAFSLSGKTTRLDLSGVHLKEKFNYRLRQTAVGAQSEELVLGVKEIDLPLWLDTITLAGKVDDLKSGRSWFISGKRVHLETQIELSLAPEDGSAAVALPAHTVVELLQTPLPTGGWLAKWPVRTAQGLVGVIETIIFAFRVAPPFDDSAILGEQVTLKSVDDSNELFTQVKLNGQLAYWYSLPSVTIYGNVAPATHGESRQEILGSGDGSQTFQKFKLKNKPLTYTAAATPSGSETTLEVRVDDVLWQQVDTLLGATPRQRAYVSRIDDDGTVMIEFGDGKTGARLPSGLENVRAKYRYGTGAAGMVKPNQLSLLMSSILGVTRVTNPQAPSGAADPEHLSEARQNAPFTVLTLGRIVSLQDFEDFSRAFTGVGKAQATWLWDGEQRMVHLTVAAKLSNGIDYRIDPKSNLAKQLRKSIDLARDTHVKLQIDTYQPLFFRLKAEILVEDGHLPEIVLSRVKSLVQTAYSFAARNFGQPVTQSELLAVLQGAPGVRAAFLKKLYLRTSLAETLENYLEASRAGRDDSNQIHPAALLLADERGIDITEKLG